MRTGRTERETRETRISVEVNLDGSGKSDVETPITFLNHVLASLATHSMMDIEVRAEGDLKHHIAEDTALCLGSAIKLALEESEAISRFGYATVPMDCSLATAAVDLGNRPYWVVDLGTKGPVIEDMPSEDVAHFLESLAASLRANIHVSVEYGANDHHRVEAAFKALALSLRQALVIDPRRTGVPSSKGVL
jgi:imidazoleglycerol-phosphate dehydratase